MPQRERSGAAATQRTGAVVVDGFRERSCVSRRLPSRPASPKVPIHPEIATIVAARARIPCVRRSTYAGIPGLPSPRGGKDACSSRSAFGARSMMPSPACSAEGASPCASDRPRRIHARIAIAATRYISPFTLGLPSTVRIALERIVYSSAPCRASRVPIVTRRGCGRQARLRERGARPTPLRACRCNNGAHRLRDSAAARAASDTAVSGHVSCCSLLRRSTTQRSPRRGDSQ